MNELRWEVFGANNVKVAAFAAQKDANDWALKYDVDGYTARVVDAKTGQETDMANKVIVFTQSENSEKIPCEDHLFDSIEEALDGIEQLYVDAVRDIKTDGIERTIGISVKKHTEI